MNEKLTNEQETELLNEIADIAIDSIKEVVIPLEPKNFIHKWFQKKGWCKKERVFALRRARVNTSIKISALSQKIPDELEVDGITKFAMDNLTLYGESLILAVAWAIQNNRDAPSKELIDFVRHDMEWQTIEDIIDWCIPSIQKSFLNTIVSIKGTSNILKPKTSPRDGEMIARSDS